MNACGCRKSIDIFRGLATQLLVLLFFVEHCVKISAMVMIKPDPITVYLAGPTVFFREAESAFLRLEHLCRQRGLHPIRPAEPVDAQGRVLQQAAASGHLFEQNTRRIRAASCVLADLRPFRGELEPDSGTVFEIGFAYALNKPVAAVVTDTRDWGSKIRSVCGVGRVGSTGLEMDGRYDMLIEDFGGSLNLMLSESCRVFQQTEQALDWLTAVTSEQKHTQLTSLAGRAK